MCRDCGCQQAGFIHLDHDHHSHDPEHLHNHGHAHGLDHGKRIVLEQSVLAKNDQIARENRNWFEMHGIRVLNLMSSPGAGKTLLLEKSVELLRFPMVVLAGDQERDFDARRLEAAGADVLQLNTGSACHLTADLIQGQLGQFIRPEHRLLVIENVGNLVCPAAFDLGESQKVAILSTPEGEDKPSKYPLLFHEADLIVISKIDLVPHLDWNLDLCEKHIRRVNGLAPILHLSSKTGQGMGPWIDFLERAIDVPSSISFSGHGSHTRCWF